MSNQHILVVDDEEDLCEILRLNLEAAGFIVSTAMSADEALPYFGLEGASLSQAAPDLVLLDVMMPGMSGVELLRLLRGRGVETPVIFLTARSDEAALLAGFEAGADDYVGKPFSFEAVLARVRAVLRRCAVNEPPAAALTRREHLILQLLRSHRGSYLSRAEILAAVWPGDALVGERAVDVHIARLRKKLGGEGGRIVGKTGFGYGLV
ncbi:MAG: response regulator transcription factor [Bacteroidales bacterium]|nr:response regulator transcription factor [Bacteroidales bacterium]